MQWTLDTGSLGADGCEAKDLRAHLEKELAHHASTTPEAAAREVQRQADRSLLHPDHPKALENQNKLTAACNKASDAVTKKLPRLQKQMQAGIDAACLLADAHGPTTRVTATVTGHLFPRHGSVTKRRIQVGVDEVAPVESDDEE